MTAKSIVVVADDEAFTARVVNVDSNNVAGNDIASHNIHVGRVDGRSSGRVGDK